MEILVRFMAVLHILEFNLAIQLTAVLVCLWGLNRMRTAGKIGILDPVFLTEGSFPHWHADPITEAITKLESANETITDLKREVEVLKSEAVFRNELTTHYVTKEAFDPVRSIVYGIVAFVGLSFLASIVAVIAWKTAK